MGQARFAWVLKAVEDSSEMRGDLNAGDIFPGQTSEQRMEMVMKVRSWLSAQPLSRRVLVKVSCLDVSLEDRLPAYQFAS